MDGAAGIARGTVDDFLRVMAELGLLADANTDRTLVYEVLTVALRRNLRPELLQRHTDRLNGRLELEGSWI